MHSTVYREKVFKLNVKFRASYGTIGALGMKKLKADVDPTTAYLMIGHACVNDCAFCTQAVSSIAANADKISRVTWPEVDTEELMTHLIRCVKGGKVQRICVQVVGGEEAIDTAVDAVSKLSSTGECQDVPISVSFTATSCVEDVKRLVNAGADKVSLPIDACNPDLYSRIKGGDYLRALKLIEEASAKFPGRIGTHIIVGLGETERDVISLICRLKCLNVGFGLFAFTPVPGTKMADCPPPGLNVYRRLQLCAHLVRENVATFSDFQFSEDASLKSISIPLDAVKRCCADGTAFRTSGCSGCNRPYFNEKPGKAMYNYPRPLTPCEAEAEFSVAVDGITFGYDEGNDIVSQKRCLEVMQG